MFETARETYINECKPDPLMLKQVQQWRFEWQEKEADTITKDEVHNETCPDEKRSVSNATGKIPSDMASPCPSPPQQQQQQQQQGHQIAGTLTIHGDHMAVILYVHTEWYWDEKVGKGMLTFRLEAKARFRTKREIGKQDRVGAKVRSGMVKRLRSDDYIQKLLQAPDIAVVETKRNNKSSRTSSNRSKTVEEGASVCDATVFLDETSSELEERVSLDQDILEAIRRCLFSHAETSLMMIEALASLPYLETSDCGLGSRAKLRILEDAMVDACEQEEEDEMLQELVMSSGARQGQGDYDEENGSDNGDEESDTRSGLIQRPKRKKTR